MDLLPTGSFTNPNHNPNPNSILLPVVYLNSTPSRIFYLFCISLLYSPPNRAIPLTWPAFCSVTSANSSTSPLTPYCTTSLTPNYNNRSKAYFFLFAPMVLCGISVPLIILIICGISFSHLFASCRENSYIYVGSPLLHLQVINFFNFFNF